MKRREFLKKIPGLSAWFIMLNQLWSRTFAQILYPHKITHLTVYRTPTTPVSLPIWWRQEVPYVSAASLANAFQYHTYFNELKRKLVIYLPFNQKIVVAAENPFIKIDDKTLQMPIPALWSREEIYLPLPFLVPLINQYVNSKWEYDEKKQVLRVSSSGDNVFGGTIAVKENGIVIRLRTTQKFKPGEMTADYRNQWLHVDLYGARGDAQSLNQTPLKGYIREIKTYQFKELLSVAFRLSKLPLTKEIYQDPDTNEVVVVLRYQERIAESEKEKEVETVPDEEIQEQLEKERSRWLIDTVVIDAGHGGKDPGAIGSGKTKEKYVVLAVAKKLGNLIKKKMPGVKVIYTRSNDVFVPLRRRTQIANESNAKVFISIHANSNRNRNVRGFETYILGPEKGERAREVVQKENAVIQFEDASSQEHYRGINNILATMAQSAFMKQSEHLAAQVQQELARRLHGAKTKSRGVKQAPFWVMVGASMPSILVEIGFITNPYEARLLRTSSYQQKIAEGIYSGLKKFKEDYESAI